MISLRFPGKLVASQSSFCSWCRPPAGQGAQREVGCGRRAPLAQGTCPAATCRRQESTVGTDWLPCPLLAGERHYRVRCSGVFPCPRSPSSFLHCPPCGPQVLLTYSLLCDKEVLPSQQTGSTWQVESPFLCVVSSPPVSVGSTPSSGAGVLDSPRVQTVPSIQAFRTVRAQWHPWGWKPQRQEPQISLCSPVLRRVVCSEVQLSQEEPGSQGSVGSVLWEMAGKCGTRVHCQGMAPSVALVKETGLGGPCYLWKPTPLTI